MKPYQPVSDRYERMQYNRCGASGLMLPKLALGLWHNFGHDKPYETARSICRTAFDLGITHFDLANNYGPPPGSAEECYGRILKDDFGGLRDELIISSKAGYRMWPGPYGEWGSKKYLVASLDQSLKRMGLDYVDIFYSHRYDPNTPLEETMATLDLIVRQGKALYVGISSYTAEQTRRAAAILKQLGTPCIIHQPSYSVLNRWTERDNLLEATAETGMGCIVFSPLAQGLLTDKYLAGNAAAGRAGEGKSLNPAVLDQQRVSALNALAAMARSRAQSLAQMSIAWALRDPRMTTALIGASRPEQVTECVGALQRLDFTPAELAEIDRLSQPVLIG
jgi:L-glyceraldehyde 3-phosphate reductase